MKQKLMICAFAALGLIGCKHYAHEVYVSSINGSDDNLGTQESPFKTIARAHNFAIENGIGEDTASFTFYLEGTFEIEGDDWGTGLYYHNNNIIGYGNGNAVLKFSQKDYGIWLEDEAPTNLKNLTISNVSGCGINIENSGAFMENCIIENCTEGGIRTGFDSYLYMKNCIVRNNTKTNSGAGIEASYTAMHLDNCQIINNKTVGESVSTNGGGIYIMNGTEKYEDGYLIENCVISGNEAHNTGGGICANIRDIEREPYTIQIKNTKISGNTAYDAGGLVVYEFVTVEASDVEVTGNTATNSCGGICVIDNTLIPAKGTLTGDYVCKSNTPDDMITYKR